MINRAFEYFLRGLDASTITEIFLWAILGALIVACVAERTERLKGFSAYAPTLLTSLGILGTFVGIVVGLLEFDPDPARLDKSIASLLEGLKTAFITSVAGMSASIAFKILATTLLKRRVESLSAADVGPQDILAALHEQTLLLRETKTVIAGSEESSLSGQIKLLRTDVNDQSKILIDTRKAIAGDEQSSLVGQFKLLRQDMEDHHRDARIAMEKFAELLWQKLSEFAEMLSRSATHQVVEALRQVIADFNKNLTEQFGDNFKALDASVQKLVEWQEHYRQQLQELHGLYSESVKGIKEIEEAVTRVAEASTVIPNTMEQLRTMVETANFQLSELERHLDAFRELRDKATEAIPKVQSHVEEMTMDIAASVKVASDHYAKLLSVSDAYIEAQNELSQEMLKNLTSAGVTVQRDTQSVQEAVAASLEKMRADIESVTTKTLQAQQAATTTAVDALATFSRNAVAKAQEGVEGQINLIDELARHLQQQTESTIRELTTTQTRAVNQGVESLLDQMRQAVARTGEGVNGQLEAIDQSMQREINRVMNHMGGALAQIAGKFTEDYTQLTGAMHQIVRQSERRP